MKKIKVHDCVLSQRVPDIRVVKEQEIDDSTTHFGLCLSGEKKIILDFKGVSIISSPFSMVLLGYS